MLNLIMLHTIAEGLDYLLPGVVFVGGSVTEIYATDAAATEVRPTNDVDCVVELVSYSTFYQLEEQLRKLKFVNDTEDGIICRWRYAGIKVDIMPVDASILGFTNPWYEKGLLHTFDYKFEDGIVVRLFEPAYFLATKFVALKNRGGNDLRTSSDFEDIIYVLDNRTNLVGELNNADNSVVTFIIEECKQLLAGSGLPEAVFCALPSFSGEARINSVLQTIKRISEI
jgi:predicted nucleotidyltransferase